MKYQKKQGFTLVELLVVVLIIGILAAVALPQYNKTVKHAQGREVLVAIDALDKSLTDYYLEHDSYGIENFVGSAGGGYWTTDPASQEHLDIQIPTLKYFKFSSGGHSFDQGSTQSNGSKYQVTITNGTPYSNLRPGECSIYLYWEDGHLTDKLCTPIDVCTQYFDGTVVQSGTSTFFRFD